MPYAERTSVPVTQTIAAIQRLLQKHHASDVTVGLKGDKTQVQFDLAKPGSKPAIVRTLRLTLPLPDLDAYKVTPGGQYRWSLKQRAAALKQDHMARHRALLAHLVAKFASQEAGIVEWESLWMAETVMPDGTTAAETFGPVIAEAVSQRQMPALPAPSAPRVTIEEQS